MSLARWRNTHWDQDVLEIPRSILPVIQPSCSLFGSTRTGILGRSIPVTASLVDQQAALFGQACYAPNDVKVTYGTGAFIVWGLGHRGLLLPVDVVLVPAMPGE